MANSIPRRITGIDWSHPLARGLVTAVPGLAVGSHTAVDLANRSNYATASDTVNQSIVLGPDGRSWLTSPLDGDRWILNAGKTPPLVGETAFTISIWMRNYTDTASGFPWSVGGASGHTDQAYNLRIHYPSTHDILLGVGNGTLTQNFSFTSALAINDGQEHHVVVSWNDATGTAILFQNGAHIQTVSGTSGRGAIGSSNVQQSLTMLGNGEFSALSWNGEVSDYREWNRALSFKEIRSLYYKESRWSVYKTDRRLFILPTGIDPIAEEAPGEPVSTVIGQAVETNSAGAVTVLKTMPVGQALETDTGQAVTAVQMVAITQAVEADTGQAVSVLKVLGVGQTVETDTGLPVASSAVIPVGQASEVDTGQPVSSSKVLGAGQALETDSGLAVVVLKVLGVGQAVETDTGQPVGSSKVLGVNQATEVDTGQPVTASAGAVVGQAVETDSGLPVGSSKVMPVGQASETDTATVITAVHVLAVLQALENNSAQGVLSTKVLGVGQAVEIDSGLPVSGAVSVAVGQASEVDTAQVVVPEQVVAVVQAAESDIALGATWYWTVVMGQATETDIAFAVSALGSGPAQVVDPRVVRVTAQGRTITLVGGYGISKVDLH